jgi:polyferredoxin
MKKVRAGFIISMLLAIALFLLIIQRRVRRNLYFFFAGNYYAIIYLALILGFIFVLLKDKSPIKKWVPWLKYPYYILFLPLAVFPVVRCYFRVPYVFCKTCPNKCPWGVLRPVMIPAFVLQNLDCRFWCFKMCPCGTLQDYQCKMVKKRIKLPKWLKGIRWVFLVLTVFVVVMMALDINDFRSGFLYTGVYHALALTLIAGGIIFSLCFFIPRFWCNYFCPIGSFGDLMLKVEGKLARIKGKKCDVKKKGK